jgi:hypothetical protein
MTITGAPPLRAYRAVGYDGVCETLDLRSVIWLLWVCGR